MCERKIEPGEFVFELFEESPRVLEVLGVKNNVVTVEIEHGVSIAHISNFRLATAEEIRRETQ